MMALCRSCLLDFVVDIHTLFSVEALLEDLSLQVSECSSFTLFVSCGCQVIAQAGSAASLIV